jgi:E3 ubiquitin-protein ligase HUWE1
MTSFIHNEPTSLAILQEGKIPQTLLASLSKAIPASNDVAMNLPGAFGAICLNPAGLEMFTKEFQIKKFFDMFKSVPHVRSFQDNDIASSLGVSMDELVRHQPTLKASVMTEIVDMLKQVLKMCESSEVMEDDIAFSTLQTTRAKNTPLFGEVTEDDSSKDDRKDSSVAQLIEASARVSATHWIGSPLTWYTRKRTKSNK